MPSLIPRDSRSVLVTNKSSPTNWIFFFDELLPTLCVNCFHPARSSSAIPSSIDTMGYFSVHRVQYAAISAEDRADLSDFLKTYLPLPLSKNSLEAGSRAMLTCSPGLYPAAPIASSTIWIASSFDLQFGANPPSSPTAVEYPCFFRAPFNE